MGHYSKAPLGDGALPELITGDAGNDAIAALHYSTYAPPSIAQCHCARLVTWLRCHACHRDYFAAGAPVPQPCPTCAGGRLHHVGLWDLAYEAASPNLVRRGEGHHAYLG
jgi:hypothetical protein